VDEELNWEEGGGGMSWERAFTEANDRDKATRETASRVIFILHSLVEKQMCCVGCDAEGLSIGSL